MRKLMLVWLLLCATVSAREITVQNKAALANVIAAPGDTVNLLGYVTPGDGGGQPLYYSISAGGTVDDGFIFDAPGASTERFIAMDQSIADPDKFGACVGGNVTVPLQKAINSGKPVINRNANRVYSIGSPGLTNPLAVPMEIAGTVSSTDTANPVVTIGLNTVERFCKNRVFRLNVDRAALPVTASTDTILGTPDDDPITTADGVRIINCVDGQWHISARHCDDGINMRGDDGTAAGAPTLGACARNQIWLGNINDCFVGVHLQGLGEGGYCNENTFYGGEIDTYGTINTDRELKGIVLEYNGDTVDAHQLDGNRFYGQSIELHNLHATALKHMFYSDFTDAGLAMAATENVFLDFRMEAGSSGDTNTSNYRICGGRGWVNNTFRSNFMLGTTNTTFGVTAGDVWGVRTAAYNQFHLRNEANDFVRLATVQPRQMVNTASGATAPPHGVIITAAGGEAFQQFHAQVAVTATEITVTPVLSSTPAWVGVPIDMTLSVGLPSGQVHDMCDRVVHVQYTLGDDGGRIFARCYNADRTTIEGDADDCSLGPYLGGSHAYFHLDAIAGQDGSGRPYLLPIAFGPNVAYAIIGFGGIGTPEVSHMKHFELFSKKKAAFRLLNDDATINLISGSTRYPIFADEDMPRSPVVPTGTVSLHGTLVRNTSETALGAGNPVFWRFNAATPGWAEVLP